MTISRSTTTRARRPVASLLLAVALGAIVAPPAAADATEFPAGDERFHTYREMVAQVRDVAERYPAIVRMFSIGESAEGRALWAAEVSDNVGVDEREPEVLFDGLHHGLEHMSAEMTLAILRWLTEGYAVDDRIRAIVDGRRIWIVFMVNPDGGEYDVADGAYRDWRRNRQPTPGTDQVGTDVNRNYDFRWGCCGGSSPDPASSQFRGPAPFSTPEARAMRDLLASRVVDGRQRIRTAISFHTSGRLIMYPYGFTRVDVPPQMTRLDHETLGAMARAMAATNGYRPQQSSDLYISDGTYGSYAYGVHRIMTFVFELTRGDHPPDERIARETERNRDAVLYLLEIADCPYRAIGREAAYCGPLYDDLEIARGWTVDPDGTDDATAGRWGRGAARAGTFALGGAVSGRAVLTTGRPAEVDVDGGRTTVRSPAFRLPAGPATLRLRAWVGLSAAAGPGDVVQVRLVDADGALAPATLFEAAGDGTDQVPAWRRLALPLPERFAGARAALELVAVDDPADGDATVEAAIDDPRVTAG